MKKLNNKKLELLNYEYDNMINEKDNILLRKLYEEINEEINKEIKYMKWRDKLLERYKEVWEVLAK